MYVDICRFLATSTGTGDFVVSAAVLGYVTPANAGALDAGTYYYRAESGDLSQWEIGQGVYTASGTTLARTTVIASSSGGSKVSFSAVPQVGMGVALTAGLRERLTAARTYYVRTDGNDSHTGLANTSGAAWLTIQHAWDWVVQNLDLGGQTVTISVQAGTYTAGVASSNGILLVNGVINIEGDTTTPGNVIISPSVATNACFQLTFDGVVGIAGFKVAGGANVNYGIYCSGGARVNIYGKMEYGAISSSPAFAYPSGNHIGVNSVGRIFISSDYLISGSAGSHFTCTHGGVIEIGASITVTLTGTPAFGSGFVYCLWSGIATLASITFSGSATGARYNVQYAGMIDTGAAGATYFPGNSAGTLGDAAGNRGNYF